MTSIFLFALILGGGLLGLSLLGDLVGGGDADFDTDVDADLELDGDLGADGALDTGGGHGTDVAGAVRIFTIRNLTYFLFGFGAVGWLLATLRPDLSMIWVSAAAVAAGVLSGGAAALVFGWLRATDAGWQTEESGWVGCEGRVVLPLGHDRTGQIVVRRGHREHELRAVPFDARAAVPESWRTVVVVEMNGGTAQVAPMEALESAESGPAIP